MNSSNVNHLPAAYIAEDKSAPLLVTSIVFLVLETIFMLLMRASRYFAKAEWENRSMDIFMSLTYIICIGKIAIAILLVKIGGAGHHLVTLPPSTIKNSLKLSVALAIVCPLTASLSKIGVLCLFYHIFGRSGRWYRSAIRTTFGLVLGIMIAQVLIPFVNCRPFSKTWNPHTPGHCTVTGLSLWRYLSIPNVVTTALVVAIPVPALAKLQVSRLITLTLTAVLFASVLGIVAAVMRLQAFLEITNFDDITYENVKPFCWTVVESGIYLITGIMPMLKPLVRRMLGEATLDRLLTKGSRGWGTKSFQKRWYRRGPLATRATTDKQESSSDVWMEEIVLARPQLPRTFKGEVMWV